jgi:DNA (cytosine-5)-methyltransferase 1
MKHLGDITKINGAEIEVVDVITGGSPCQDLSIAGKRAGLAGARSGLFMEQVRIVKEMRERDRKNGRTGDMVRPRFMVWENVPGAFSSNKGRDFAAVLEEIIRIAEPEAPDIEVPEKGWNTWGGYHDEVGGRWSKTTFAATASRRRDNAWTLLGERLLKRGRLMCASVAGANSSKGL